MMKKNFDFEIRIVNVKTRKIDGMNVENTGNVPFHRDVHSVMVQVLVIPPNWQ